MIKPSKLSAINIATASETVRTMRVSHSSVVSKIDSNRSSKTGSGFRIRTRVSTKTRANCSLESRNPAFPALAVVVTAPRPASAAAKVHPQLLSLSLQPINKCFTRQDRCCRHRDVRFRTRPLLNTNFPAVVQQCIFDHLRIGKFIGERSRAVRLPRQQILDDAGVSPAEQAVEIAEFLVELVVTRGPDCNQVGSPARDPPDFFCQRMNPCVRSDPLTVLHP